MRANSLLKWETPCCFPSLPATPPTANSRGTATAADAIVPSGWRPGGYYFRQSAKTRQWAEAEVVRLQLEDALLKGLPPFGTAAAGSATPIPTPADPPPAARTEVPEPRIPKPRPRVRDTFAVEMLLAGVPIDQVSLLLGHASVKITEKSNSPFVKARQVQLQESVRKAWKLGQPTGNGPETSPSAPSVSDTRRAGWHVKGGVKLGHWGGVKVGQ
jgi:hypothetical protein